METLLGLIWSLNFECLHKGHFRQINLAIRVFVSFVETLDKGFFIRAAGWTDIDLDIEARQEADEGGREITPRPTAHEARITVKNDLLRTTPLAQGLK